MDTDMQQTPNNDWEILTDNGWSEFGCLKITNTEFFVELRLTCGSVLSGTIGHKVMSHKNWVEIESLKPRDFVKVVKGYSRVVSVELVSGGKAYDFVDVKKESRYFTNDILSHNCDEFAHLGTALGEEFIASVFPTISASKESKLVLVSTPKGKNSYHKIWVDAEKGINGFVPCEGHWSEHPDRDQAWADEQRSTLGEVKYQQEIECVGEKTLVTTRHKVTGKIETMTIKELMNIL